MYAYRRAKPEDWAKRCMHVIVVSETTNAMTPSRFNTRRMALIQTEGAAIYSADGICALLEEAYSAQTYNDSRNRHAHLFRRFTAAACS
jgi:hypothetical protein